MIGLMLRRSALGLGALAMILPSIARADTPGDLRDLIGIRGSSSDSELSRRGYSLAKSSDYAGYWWNGSRKNCVSVVVDNGRVQDINTETSKQCGKSGSGDAVAAVAVGALLVAAIAAAASHKKHDRDDNGYDHGSGYSYSPAGGIICYPRQSSCYDQGNFSPYWTRREF